jgi:putative SOS response-associated peptidase YedK
MCGRFVSSSPPDEIARYFDVDQVAEARLEPSFNVAPTNDVYVVYETGDTRRLRAMHWGLVPFWADGPKIGNRMINARAEGIATKPAFRHAFAKQRCIVPADGFYEWKSSPGQKRKQPYYIHPPDGEPYAFAGLWEAWRPKTSESEPLLLSCTVVTCDANTAMSELHDRMPVMLAPSSWSTWLDPDVHDADLLGQLLVPAPDHLITFHRVASEVGNPRTEGAHLIEEEPSE